MTMMSTAAATCRHQQLLLLALVGTSLLFVHCSAAPNHHHAHDESAPPALSDAMRREFYSQIHEVLMQNIRLAADARSYDEAEEVKQRINRTAKRVYTANEQHLLSSSFRTLRRRRPHQSTSSCQPPGSMHRRRRRRPPSHRRQPPPPNRPLPRSRSNRAPLPTGRPPSCASARSRRSPSTSTAIR